MYYFTSHMTVFQCAPITLLAWWSRHEEKNNFFTNAIGAEINFTWQKWMTHHMSCHKRKKMPKHRKKLKRVGPKIGLKGYQCEKDITFLYKDLKIWKLVAWDWIELTDWIALTDWVDWIDGMDWIDWTAWIDWN